VSKKASQLRKTPFRESKGRIEVLTKLNLTPPDAPLENDRFPLPIIATQGYLSPGLYTKARPTPHPSGRQTELLQRKNLSEVKHAINHGLEGAPMNSNEGNFGLLKQIVSSCRTLPIEIVIFHSHVILQDGIQLLIRASMWPNVAYSHDEMFLQVLNSFLGRPSLTHAHS